MEDHKSKKITIIDVAKRAGVSKGTVDRVVHHRGEVSKSSEEKVLKAIEELQYQPNLYASMLASRKVTLIVLLLPQFSKGEFWEKIYDGFISGAESVKPLSIKTKTILYDQYSPASFKEACSTALEEGPSGVVIAPLFRSETESFASKLRDLKIPYVYVDTKLEEDGYLAYFGMPMYRSGTMSAVLLTERCRQEEVDKVAIVRIQRDRTKQSDPTVTRRAGFVDYMNQHFPDCELINVFVDPNDPASIAKTLDAFSASHQDIRFVVMFNSRVHLLESWLRNHPAEGRRVIGFDNLDLNIDLLREGLVDVLISQHTETLSANAVSALADYVLLGKTPQRKDNYMHMDILTEFNIDNY